MATLLLSCAALLVATRSAASIAVALPFALLVSFHLQPYDLLLLALPLALLLLHRNPPRSKWLAGAGLLILVAPAGPALLAFGNPCWLMLPVAGVLMAARLASQPGRSSLPANPAGQMSMEKLSPSWG